MSRQVEWNIKGSEISKMSSSYSYLFPAMLQSVLKGTSIFY